MRNKLAKGLRKAANFNPNATRSYERVGTKRNKLDQQGVTADSVKNVGTEDKPFFVRNAPIMCTSEERGTYKQLKSIANAL